MHLHEAGCAARYLFIFNDSLQSGGSPLISQGEGNIGFGSAAGLAEGLPNKYFAGIVCVAD